MIPDSVFEFDIDGSPNELPWFDEVATACRYFYYCSSSQASISKDIAYLADIQDETTLRIYSTGHLTYSTPEYEARIAQRLSNIDPESPAYVDAISVAVREFLPSRSEFIAALKNSNPEVDHVGSGNRKDLDRLLAAASKFSVDISTDVIRSTAHRFVSFDSGVRNDIRCWYAFEAYLRSIRCDEVHFLVS